MPKHAIVPRPRLAMSRFGAMIEASLQPKMGSMQPLLIRGERPMMFAVQSGHMHPL